MMPKIGVDGILLMRDQFESSRPFFEGSNDVLDVIDNYMDLARGAIMLYQNYKASFRSGHKLKSIQLSSDVLLFIRFDLLFPIKSITHSG